MVQDRDIVAVED